MKSVTEKGLGKGGGGLGRGKKTFPQKGFSTAPTPSTFFTDLCREQRLKKSALNEEKFKALCFWKEVLFHFNQTHVVDPCFTGGFPQGEAQIRFVFGSGIGRSGELHFHADPVVGTGHGGSWH